MPKLIIKVKPPKMSKKEIYKFLLDRGIQWEVADFITDLTIRLDKTISIMTQIGKNA
jgi:hypothetical protein